LRYSAVIATTIHSQSIGCYDKQNVKKTSRSDIMTKP